MITLFFVEDWKINKYHSIQMTVRRVKIYMRMKKSINTILSYYVHINTDESRSNRLSEAKMKIRQAQGYPQTGAGGFSY
jgi:hypothetical protein